MRRTYLALIFVPLLSLILGFSHSESSDGDAIMLVLNSNPGDKQVLEINIDQHITTQGLIMDQTIVMNMTLITKEVKGISGFVFEGSFNRWAMKMDMNGEGITNAMEFDTQDATKTRGEMAPMMSEIFSKMIGLPFMMEMARNGNLIKTNMKEVMASVLPSESTASMNDDAMETIPFPDHPVKPGDSWEGVVKKNVGGSNMLVRYHYTLKEVREGVVHIAVSGTVVNENQKQIGTVAGTCSVSASTGMLKTCDIKMLFDMEIDNNAGEKQLIKMDQTIRMTGKS